jgi:DNA-binding response OmpR family regulator
MLSAGGGVTAPAVGAAPFRSRKGDRMQEFTGRDRLRVLLVDDHVTSRIYTTAALRQGGLTVCAARDVATAARLAECVRPGIVVSDWRLPDGNGRDVFESTRARTRPPSRFVLLCGAPDDIPAYWLARTGITRVLRKPCSPAELLAAVQAVPGTVGEESPVRMGRLQRAARRELREQLPALAADLEQRRLEAAGARAHQLAAAAALGGKRELATALRALSRACGLPPDPARVAHAWCRLETAAGGLLEREAP